MTSSQGTVQNHVDVETPKVNTVITPFHRWLLVALVAISIPAVGISARYSQSLNSMVPETLPNPSTYNEKPSGYSGFYELCQKVGLQPNRWERPYRMLAEDHVRGTLIVLLPWEWLEKSETKDITDWVSEGNDLVYLDLMTMGSGSGMLNALGLEVRGHRELRNAQFAVSHSVPEGQNAPRLHLSTDSKILNGEPIIIANDDADDGESYLVSVDLGKGRCLVGAQPNLCSNKYLANKDYRNNFQFLINWLATSKRPIYFDERSHGHMLGTNVFFFLLRGPVGLILLQMLILLAVAFISLNQRFGRALSVPNGRRISNLEFINGLASTYERAHARDTAWSMIFAPFKAKLSKSVGVAPDVNSDTLSQAWSETSGKPVAELRSFLADAEAAVNKPALTDKELKDLVASFDRLS